MRPLLLAVLLLSGAVLAGCADPPPPGTSTTPTTVSSAASSPPPSSFPPPAPSEGGNATLRACRNLSGNFAVPAEEAQAFLPAGFSLVPADATGEVVLWVVTVECATALAGGASHSDVALAYAELAVVPPAGLKASGIDDNTLPVFALVSPPLVGAIVSLGWAGVRTGAIASEALASGGTTFVATSGDDSMRLTAQPTGAASDGAAGEFRVYGAQGTTVKSIVKGTYSGGASTPGAVSLVASGSLPLLAHARPLTRGGATGPFDLGYLVVG